MVFCSLRKPFRKTTFGRATHLRLFAAMAKSVNDYRFPIETLHIGTTVGGVVTGRNNSGVYVDIGSYSDAWIQLSEEVRAEYRNGDMVSGLTVKAVDVERKWITCIGPDAARPDAARTQASGHMAVSCLFG